MLSYSERFVDVEEEQIRAEELLSGCCHVYIEQVILSTAGGDRWAINPKCLTHVLCVVEET